MLLAPSVSGRFKWRQFEPEVILLAIGWYLRFSLSYRDVEKLLAERGLLVDHVTVWRWVQSYAPELERRLRQKLRPTNDSWRVDSDLYQGQGQVGVFIQGCGFERCDDRLPPLGQTRCSGGRAHPRQSVRRREPSGAAGNQHRQARRLSAGHRATQIRSCAGGKLLPSNRAISQQCSGTGSSGDQAPGPCEPAFSLLLGSLAYDRRL